MKPAKGLLANPLPASPVNSVFLKKHNEQRQATLALKKQPMRGGFCHLVATQWPPRRFLLPLPLSLSLSNRSCGGLQSLGGLDSPSRASTALWWPPLASLLASPSLSLSFFSCQFSLIFHVGLDPVGSSIVAYRLILLVGRHGV